MTKIINIKEYSDAELLKSFKSGELDVSILYNRYKLLVFGTCMKYLKNKVDSDDAVSEIFVIVDNKLRTHKVDNLKSWLYTVTKNYCMEIFRKQGRQRDKKKEAEFMYSDQIFHPDDLKDEVLFQKLEKCIEKLPPKQKNTIVSFYYDKKSYKLIAEEHDISWAKIRSFIQNGRRNLKLCLEK